MCEKQIYRFDHFTIRFASKIHSTHSKRVNGVNFRRIFPPSDKGL